MSELKECPFCGQQAGLPSRYIIDGKGFYTVKCTQCHAHGPAEDTKELASDAWNYAERKP